jgi:hypothetical protein
VFKGYRAYGVLREFKDPLDYKARKDYRVQVLAIQVLQETQEVQDHWELDQQETQDRLE